MRRKDREMDYNFGLYVIDKSQYCTLSTIHKNKAYSIPFSTARVDEYIYIHGANDGTKAEIFKENPEVQLVFVTDVKVPNSYTKNEIESLKNPHQIISKVFTTEFASAIVTGKVEECLDEDIKILGLGAICEKYTPNMLEYFDTAIETSLKRTTVWRIEIDSLTSKKKIL